MNSWSWTDNKTAANMNCLKNQKTARRSEAVH